MSAEKPDFGSISPDGADEYIVRYGKKIIGEDGVNLEISPNKVMESVSEDTRQRVRKIFSQIESLKRKLNLFDLQLSFYDNQKQEAEKEIEEINKKLESLKIGMKQLESNEEFPKNIFQEIEKIIGKTFIFLDTYRKRRLEKRKRDSIHASIGIEEQEKDIDITLKSLSDELDKVAREIALIFSKYN